MHSDSDAESDSGVDISTLQKQSKEIRQRKQQMTASEFNEQPCCSKQTTHFNVHDKNDTLFSSSDESLDQSLHERPFYVDDCEVHSSESDERSLAEEKRRRRKQNLIDRSVLLSTSETVMPASHECLPSTSISASTHDNSPNQGSVLPHELFIVKVKEENVRFRKRIRDETKWKKNKIKQLRQTGKEYVSESGKQFKARELKPPCPPSCIRKCATLFSEEERKAIFEQYWQMGNKNDQRHFISCMVEKCAIQRATCNKSSTRQWTLKYFFFREMVKVQVCRTFFLNTLDVKKDFVQDTVDKQNDKGIFQQSSGKHGNQKKWSRASIDSVKRHIESFPKVDSHYCQKRCGKEFLHQSLNVREMYRLFSQKCTDEGITDFVSRDKYQRIFNEEFNFSFFRPKKDRCDDCVMFENLKSHITKVDL